MLLEFIKRKNYFYLSGVIAVIYNKDNIQIYNQLRTITNYLNNQPGIRIIHILYENAYFKSHDKFFSDLVDGTVIPFGTLCL